MRDVKLPMIQFSCHRWLEYRSRIDNHIVELAGPKVCFERFNDIENKGLQIRLSRIQFQHHCAATKPFDLSHYLFGKLRLRPVGADDVNT